MTEDQIGRHDRRESWASQAVNWGQLIIALLVMLGGIFLDRLVLDRRVTIVEVEQKATVAGIDKASLADATFKSSISQRLDLIQAQLAQISVQMAQSQSLGDRLSTLERQREREERTYRRWPNGNESR
jgi:hypothetical protein